MVVHARQGFDDPNEAERKMKKAQHAQLLAMQVSEREGGDPAARDSHVRMMLSRAAWSWKRVIGRMKVEDNARRKAAEKAAAAEQERR